MPNRYGSAVRAFTKISKILFSHFRKLGHASVVYVDDSFLQETPIRHVFRVSLIPLRLHEN